jgi:Xaa-Pro dipeptidase
MRIVSSQDYAGRVERLKVRLAEAKLEGAVLVPGPNLRYFTGVESLLLERPFMMLVPVEGRARLVAPKLEAGPYWRSPVEMEILEWTDSQGWDGAIARASKELRPKGRWGVEGKAPFLFLHRLMKHASPEFEDAEPILQGLRELKDDAEGALLKKAAKILSKSFEQFPELIKEGITELELGRRAREVIYENGATKVEDLLVQSGPRAADPHGLPSSKKVKRGEGIILDISCTFEGYYADITRTLCLGESKELRMVYSEVLEAEELGIRAARSGVAVGAVDAAARNHLGKAELGKYFIHRTGHGLGLEVHEAPYIVEGGREKLKDGMCFTVEPGAYIRGKLGVRMEDDVMVERGKGVEITSPPKEFGWWT